MEKREITKLVQQLHEAKTQLRAILANVKDGILVQNNFGKILYANRIALEIFEVGSLKTLQAKKGIFYESNYEFFDEKKNVFPFSKFPGRRVIAGEKQVTEIFRIVNKTNGKTVWLNVHSSAISDKQTGKPILVVSVLKDVTRRKQTEETLRFLARAGEVLATSLQYEQILEQIARLAANSIADWCSIEMVEGNSVRLVALAHTDPGKEKLARKLREDNPIDLTSSSRMSKVIKTGKPLLIPVIPQSILEVAAKDEIQLTHIKLLNFSSVIIVPLKISNKVIGVIQVVTAESKRYFSHIEFDTMIQLAHQVSLTLENVFLYENMQKEEEKISDIISTIPGVVWEVQEKKGTNRPFDMRVTYLSKQAETVLGYSLEHLLRKNTVWFRIIHPDDLEKVILELQRFYQQKLGGTIQCRMITKD
ncbi:MAG: PAS domain S-box protein, partial [Patescibacteria group bacterium]|nr:PAS domain S-box protein [Patescibacteria group bacterium]